MLAVQGTTDATAREMLWSPITPHRDIAFADMLERELAIPTTVENDCNMMAIALRWRDPARYRDNFFAILLSHGIGMGLVLKGKLFTGTQSSGGEFGHMIHRPGGALCRCGRRGCVEAYAGDYAIWRNANAEERGLRARGRHHQHRHAGARRAARGQAEGPEREAYRKAGTAIGYGIGSLFALIDPAPVAFVGGGAAAFDLLEPAIRAAHCANRRRPAFGRHLLRHDRGRTAAHPAKAAPCGRWSSSTRRSSRPANTRPKPWREPAPYAGSKGTGAPSRFKT